MVNTRQSTPEFLGPAFDEAVQRAINALLHGLTAQITNELRQNGAWIAHIKKLFEVLGCADEFKARMASYKFEGASGRASDISTCLLSHCSGVPGRASSMSTCPLSYCSGIPGRAPGMSTCPLSHCSGVLGNTL
nr:zinc finger, CCHC-type, retrotransposon Gag domain protein [Tanacetum cinerariifolium]